MIWAQHSDGRPLLGRKLKGKSKRELRDLGLVVEDNGGRSEDALAATPGG